MVFEPPLPRSGEKSGYGGGRKLRICLCKPKNSYFPMKICTPGVEGEIFSVYTLGPKILRFASLDKLQFLHLLQVTETAWGLYRKIFASETQRCQNHIIYVLL